MKFPNVIEYIKIIIFFYSYKIIKEGMWEVNQQSFVYFLPLPYIAKRVFVYF